jgi:flavin reductase (DIM6/NTAB) family NADH-FMN oxidoreductase RutF
MSAAAPRASTIAFRRGMRSLPGAVCVVAANGVDGAPIGLTATSVTSLSADPPSLLVCVNRSAQIAAALSAGAPFSVNLLAAGQREVAEAFGGQRVAQGVARFAFGGWYRSENEVPLLAGANAAFECKVAELHDFATHHVVIGAIHDIRLPDVPAPALIYHDGRYGAVGA